MEDAVVADTARLQEHVHEKTDPGPRGADHLGRRFLVVWPLPTVERKVRGLNGVGISASNEWRFSSHARANVDAG